MKLFAYAAILAASTSIIPAAANATVTVNLAQVGPNVVATLSGSLDTTGLTQFSGGNYLFTGIDPASATINFNGPSNNSNVTGYGLAGPSTFGPGSSPTAASSTSGDAFVADGSCGCVFVPIGYVSGTPLSASDTFLGQSFASMGVTPGTYNFTDNAGAPRVIINILGAGAVPEASTWAMMLLGFGAVSLAVRRRRKEKRNSIPLFA